MAKKRNRRIPARKKPSVTRRRTIPRKPPSTTLNNLLQAVERDAGNVEARIALGTYYLHNGHGDEIPAALDPVTHEYPFSSDRVSRQFDRLLSFGLLARKKYPEAADVARRALSNWPDDADYWYVLTLAADALAVWEETIEAGQKYLRYRDGIGPQGELGDYFAITETHQTEILMAVGHACAESGDPVRAIVWLENAICNNPTNQLPYLYLARLWVHAGEHERAEAVVKQGIADCHDNDELKMLANMFTNRATVSVCMIVKDEEDQVNRCLNSLRSWVDEIIVVDTGSTDRTKDIAASYRARIFDQPWEGDFSKHRNHSLDQATGDWILIMDADEEFVEEDVPALIPALNDPDTQVIAVNVFNVYDGRAQTFLPSIRLFRRDLNLRYDGIVHNQLQVPPDQPVLRSECRILHHGYDLDPGRMKKKAERTRQLLDKQLADNPDDVFALFNYAQLLRCQPGDFPIEHAPKILECARKVVALIDPDDKSQRHLLLMCLNHIAWTEFHLGNFEVAEQMSQRALAIRPDYLDALFLIGNIYLKQGRAREGIEAFHAYLDAQATYDPAREQENLILLHLDSCAAARYAMASLAQSENDSSEASRYLLGIVQSQPGYLDAATRLGELFLRSGALDEARSCFEIQLQFGEPTVNALLGLAYVHRQQGRLKDVESCFESARDAFPDNVTVRLKHAEFLFETNRQEQAQAILTRVVENAQANSETRREAASACFAIGRYEEAAELLRAELISGNESANIYNDLGNCYFKQDDLEQAEQCYREALRLDPDEPSALRNLGLVLARTDRPTLALQNLERAFELAPHLKDLAKLIGEIRMRRGEFSAAVPMFEEAAAAQPWDPESLYSLAECYLVMGQKDAAIAGLRGVLKINPDFRPAQKRLRDLDGTSELAE